MKDLLPSEINKMSKFPAGVKMTLEEVSKVVGPQFQKMNEDPPESVIKLREKMVGKKARHPAGESVSLEKLPSELQENVKNPPPAVEKLKEDLKKKARHPEGADVPLEKLPSELQENVKNPPPAVEKLKEEMQGKEAASGLYGFTKDVQRQVESTLKKAKKAAIDIAKRALQDDQKVSGFLKLHLARNKSVSAQILLAALEEIGTSDEESSDEEPQEKVARGIYGLSTKTSSVGLAACSALKSVYGELAFNLHSNGRGDVTAFLNKHAKSGKCSHSKLILGCYPEPSVPKSASHTPVDGRFLVSYTLLGDSGNMIPKKALVKAASEREASFKIRARNSNLYRIETVSGTSSVKTSALDMSGSLEWQE